MRLWLALTGCAAAIEQGHSGNIASPGRTFSRFAHCFSAAGAKFSLRSQVRQFPLTNPD
jgi:hypothetical protein